MTAQTFTVFDVQAAGYTLDPLICILPRCMRPKDEEHCVTYSQYIGDASCDWCGRHQLEWLLRWRAITTAEQAAEAGFIEVSPEYDQYPTA